MTADRLPTGLATAVNPTSDFYIGDRHFVQPSLYRITKAGRPVRVGPKVMQVLVCLARTPGEVVHRDTLMDEVWPGSFVVEESLTRCVSELRKVFGDDPRNPATIETIRNVGYRLVAPVSYATPGDGSSGDGAVIHAAVLQAGNDAESASQMRRRRWSWLAAGVVVLLGLAVLVKSETWQAPVVPAHPLNPVPLTSYPGEERDPALSPDGNRIAFTWLGESEANVDVYLKSIGDETLVRLTDHPDWDVGPVWSPDGDRIAFMRRGRGGACSLVVASIDGESDREVGDCAGNRNADLAWSSDAAWLAFSVPDPTGGPSRVMLFSMTGSAHRFLTTPSGDTFGDFDPEFSPDGEHLTFTRRLTAETSDLFVIDLGTETERRLTFDNRMVRGHTVTPDGEHVFFASNRGGSFSLWKIPLRGGTPSWLATSGAGEARHPRMASGSGRLVFEQVMNEVNVRFFDLRADPARLEPGLLLASTGIDVMPHYSPDGRQIAFVSNRTGTYELWVASSEDRNARPMATFEGALNGDPRWSPDATKIAFASLRDQQGDVYVIDVDSGDVRQVTKSRSDEWVPRWSRDGALIYFTSNRSGSWQIWKTPADGGDPEQVTRRGGRAVMESVDGRSLYFARSDTNGIWRMPIEGGPEELVTGRSAASDWGSWEVVSDGIYFIDRRGPDRGISFFDFEKGEVVAVAAIPASAVSNITRGIPSLTVSADRRYAAFAQFDKRERDIVLIEPE